MNTQHPPAPAAVTFIPIIPPGTDDGWLGSLGDLTGERALLLGPDVGVMCALIHRGCGEVTELQRHERPEPQAADLVVLPRITSAEVAACAICHAHRALVPSGRILVRTGPDPACRLGRALRRILALNGFSGISLVVQDGCSILSAERPMFGPLTRA